MVENLNSNRINELKNKLILPNLDYPYFSKLLINNIDVHECINTEEFPGEEFKSIKGLKGNYAISNYGRVRSSEGFLKIFYEGVYRDISMVYIPQNKTYCIHRLIMETFLPFSEMSKYHVHHIDNNALNTNIENLMWINPTDHALIHKEYNILIGKITQSIYRRNLVELLFFFNNNNELIKGSQIYEHFPNVYYKILQDNVGELLELSIISEINKDPNKKFKNKLFRNKRRWLTFTST